MSRGDGNLELLQRVVRKIAPVLDDVVLVGGCAIDLLVTDPAVPPPRVTMDVDLTTEITSYVEFAALTEKLATLGFSPGQNDGDPICRFRDAQGLVVDLMPSDPEVLGFGSRWYRQAIADAWEFELPGAVTIRCITAPLFLATKLEAFRSRGHGDYMASRDLEDVVTVVNGREEIAAELRSSSRDVRTFIAGEMSRLIKGEEFKNALPGLVAAEDRARLPIVWERFELLVRCES